MINIVLFILILTYTSINSMALPYPAAIQDTLNTEYTIANKKLDIIYNKLSNILENKDRKDLEKAQNAWIKYRDSECYFQSRPMRDGIEEYTMILSCMIKLTDNRERLLNSNLHL